MDIGKAVKELRKQKGLSQTDLANAAAITQTALSQIENGKRPGVLTLKKLSSVLEVPESLLYITSIEKTDVPENKQSLYDSLFPIIKNLIFQLTMDDTTTK